MECRQRLCRYPTISPNPSTTRASSSGLASASFLPMRSTAGVRIWLILTQDFFGRAEELSSKVRGKPSFWVGW